MTEEKAINATTQASVLDPITAEEKILDQQAEVSQQNAGGILNVCSHFSVHSQIPDLTKLSSATSTPPPP